MTKKFKIATLALSACMALGVVGFTACGQAGKSAYDLWLEQGNEGTEQDFLDSLKGAAGKDGVGTNGKSAYEIWKEYHPEENLTETQWLESLKGAAGETPEISISDDGYWEINGEKTSQKAQGNDGDMPEITISDDGYWEINGQKTSQKAQGDPGDPGDPGTPGAAGARGNKITKGEGAPASTEGAVEGDMYVDTKEWHVYFFEGTEWKDYGSINGEGGAGGGVEPEQSANKLNVNAGEVKEIDIPANTAAGFYIIEADLGSAKLESVRLKMHVSGKEDKSELVFSESRSQVDHNIYFGYIQIAEGDSKITFSAEGEGENVNANLTFKNYDNEIPTLKTDGTPIEIPVNLYEKSDLKFKIDKSIQNKKYIIKIKYTADPNATSVNNGRIKVYLGHGFNVSKTNYATGTEADLTNSEYYAALLSDGYFGYAHCGASSPTTPEIFPITISLTEADT